MKRLLHYIFLSSLSVVFPAHGEKETINSGFSELDVSSLRTELVEWLSKQTSHTPEELQSKLVLNAKLEKMQCNQDIEFSFTSDSRGLIKAACEGDWRRFLRSPKWLDFDQDHQSDTKGLQTNEIVVTSASITRGERFSKSSLSLKDIVGRKSHDTFDSVEELVGAVATRDLEAGETVRKGDISLGTLVVTSVSALSPGLILNSQLVKEEMRFLDIPKDAIRSIEGWDFMEINQALSPGEVIRERHLRKAKLVRRNDPVRLISKGSAFQIEATGTALQDGYFGDRIKVSNSESNRTLVGTVIDKSTVNILID